MTIDRRSLLAALAALPFAARLAAAAGAPVTTEVAVSIRDFGGFGDGGDDTEAFRRMHAALWRSQQQNDAARAADPSLPPVRFLIRLPPGRYDYSWNRWTWGLRRVTVEGYGAVIRCISDSPFTVDQATLQSNRDHYWVWDGRGPAYGDPATPPEDWGRRIRTARPGDRRVVLIEGAAAPPLVAGAWILVQSYAQQQDGYPPNMRHFDRVRIAAADGPVLHLDRPLRHLHKDDWPERAQSLTATGRARVVAIDRPDCPLALEQAFLGLTAASNPNHSERDPVRRATEETLTVSGALRVLVKDCHLIAFLPTQAGEVVVRNCTMAYTEPDKVVESLVMEDCAIASLQQCTGINEVTLRRCTLGRSTQILSRTALVEDCRVTGAINLQGPTPTRSMTLRRCRFDAPQPFSQPEWISARVGPDAVCDDGRTLLVRPSSPPYGRLVDVLEEGAPVLVDDGKEIVAGSCSTIDSRGPWARFSFDLPRPLRLGDRLEVPRLRRLSVTDCTFANRDIVPAYAPCLDWGDEVEESSRLRQSFATDRTLRQSWLPGHLVRLAVTVTRPYAGADGAGRFLMMQDDRINIAIDLKVAGRRDMTTTSTCLLGGDRLFVDGAEVDRIPAGHYLRYLRMMLAELPRGIALTAVDATVAAAHGTIEAEIFNPLTALAGCR